MTAIVSSCVEFPNCITTIQYVWIVCAHKARVAGNMVRIMFPYVGLLYEFSGLVAERSGVQLNV